ncbi:DUF1819 family protein [Agromyces sp. SYSU T00194]|uniref:DUF1819 family protein n=1 Tax=Agromyces chitinivorans TaxID=3158560 RepID=UPI00339458F8
MNVTRDPQRYQLSFTSGALYLGGAQIGADLYLQSGDWVKVRAQLRSGNLLQARTLGTSTRWARELVQRLETLTPEEIALLADATGEELAQLMWTATCRRYELIGEFAEEVLRERFLLMKPHLLVGHFDEFVRAKVLWHEELSVLEPSTLRKLRSNLYKMLREADLITEEGVIVPTVIAPRVREHLVRRSPSDLRYFPTRDAA